MLKILLALLIIADIAVLLPLVFCLYIFVKFGGGNILLPGLGIIISGPGLLVFLLIIETILMTLTFLLARYIKKSSDKLA